MVSDDCALRSSQIILKAKAGSASHPGKASGTLRLSFGGSGCLSVLGVRDLAAFAKLNLEESPVQGSSVTLSIVRSSSVVGTVVFTLTDSNKANVEIRFTAPRPKLFNEVYFRTP